jgi:hypothetical protein
LGLQSTTWDDFVGLLTFTDANSVALMDMFCAPLRLILMDSKLLQKLSSTIPKNKNFKTRISHKGQVSSSDFDNQHDINQQFLLAQQRPELFDSESVALRLLPRKFHEDLVDNLRMQAILRVVLLRLEPVQALRRAMSDATLALSLSCSTSAFLPVIRNMLDAISQHSAGPIPHMRTNSVRESSQCGTMAQYSSDSEIVLSALDDSQHALLRSITNSDSSNLLRSRQLNRDVLFSVSNNHAEVLTAIHDLVNKLDNVELHTLSIAEKLLLLKTLCSSCFDTQRVGTLLAQNSTERTERLNEIAKNERDRKKKEKEDSVSKRAEALIVWQRLNSKENLPATAKSSKKKKDEVSSELIQSFIDELVMLGTYNIDTIVPDFELEEVIDCEANNDVRFGEFKLAC